MEQYTIGSHNIGGHVLVSYKVCTQTDKGILYDGFRSFPSGHASISFSGLTYLALLLASRLAVFDTSIRARRRANRWDPKRSPEYAVSTMGAWRVLLIILPLCVAMFVSSTRVTDYRHHYVDVLFGGAEGILMALFAYRFYFPGWAESDPNTESTATGGFAQLTSVEQSTPGSNSNRMEDALPVTIHITRRPEEELEMGNMRSTKDFDEERDIETEKRFYTGERI